MNIVIKISGDVETKRRLNKIGDDMNDMSAVMRDIGQDVGHYYANEAFFSRGGVYSNKWPPLSTSTVRNKLRKYRQYASVPLVASTVMQNSFVSKSNRQQVIITNKAPYFKYHQSSLARKHSSKTIKGFTGHIDLQAAANQGYKSASLKRGTLTLSTGGLPRRQMIGVNSRVKSMVRDRIRADISRKIRAA